MKTRPVLYLAGPFGAPDPIHGIQRNILDASEIALKAWKKGWAVICPHKKGVQVPQGENNFGMVLSRKQDIKRRKS